MMTHFKTKDRYDHVEKLMLAHFPVAERRPTVEILELAAGTGMVGQRLHRNGFRQMDAIDYSQGMLAELSKKNVYRDFWQASLGQPPFQSVVEDNTYDVVIMCGGLANGHIDIGVLGQAHSALKPGGLFINGMTEVYTKTVPELQGLDKMFFDMENQGKWKVILREIQEIEKPGLFHVCRKIQ